MTDLSVALLFLLLPLAAISGWWVANHRHHRDVPRQLNSDYFKGLNYLLNEQPDKAIEVFLRMVEVDKDTVETHFALGNLFRERGEVDRAIHIHQNLINRDSLSDEYRYQALLALAEDYMRAGLLDRAEHLFKEALSIAGNHIRALKHLASLYEQQKDWSKAIEINRKLSDQSGTNQGSVIAQYFCELAQQAKENHDHQQFLSYLDNALKADPNCVRASLMQGQFYLQEQAYHKAIVAYKQIEQQNIDYLSEAVDGLLASYAHLGKPYEVMPYLERVIAKSPGLSPMLAQATLIQSRDGDKAAEAYITKQLHQHPSVRGLDKLIDIHLASCDEGSRENLMMLRDLTKKILETRPVYHCTHCGFGGRSMHWQCPGCKHWHTVKPSHGFERE